MTVPDLLRLVAVPVFAWAAWHDIRTRRIPSRTWYPLVALGLLLIVWDWIVLPADPIARRLFLLRVAVSVGLLGVLAIGFWWFGAIGGADAKAFLTLGVLFPIYPSYELGELLLPLIRPPLGVFSLTILTDAVVLGLVVPVLLFVRNAAAGRASLAAFVGRPIPVSELLATPGRLIQTPSGFTRKGLDLDALRMYLRWRGVALSDLRATPEEFRRRSSLPAEPNPPTDGVVDADVDPDPDPGPDPNPDSAPVSTTVDNGAGSIADGTGRDPWGAETFLDAVGGAYGTTPEQLRDGLDLIVDRDRVWVSPGLPFLVPVFVGLVVALVLGDLLYVVLVGLGFS